LAAVTRRLTKKEVPDKSVIAVLSDIHIPHHDERAVRLAIECCEDAGVTHVILNGDIADCGPASRHDKKKRAAVLDEGTLRESIAPGLWIYEWARTRPCWYILGNHEAWVEDLISESPELKGTETTELMGLWGNGNGWEVLPNRSRLIYGTRVWEHGNRIFPKGDGGENPHARIKKLRPHHTTSVGHLHKRFAFYWTVTDEWDRPVTKGAHGNGHLSVPESHDDYAADASWQHSFEITRVSFVDGKPTFSTDQPEIKRDRKGRPFLDYNGRMYS
jgi:predicted phosphodiesterase